MLTKKDQKWYYKMGYNYGTVMPGDNLTVTEMIELLETKTINEYAQEMLDAEDAWEEVYLGAIDDRDSPEGDKIRMQIKTDGNKIFSQFSKGFFNGFRIGLKREIRDAGYAIK